MRRRDSAHTLEIVNGEGGRVLFEQYMRVHPEHPEWDSLGAPLQGLYQAVSDFRAAFVRHHDSPDAHPKTD